MRRKDREVTDKKIIEDILMRADVCRLAFIDGDLPYIVAMNFGVEFCSPLKLYFHSAPKGRKIELIKSDPVVCFQLDLDHNLRLADEACESSMNYKSIVGYGKINFLEDTTAKQDALNLIMNHYSVTQRNNFEYTEKDIKTTTVFELVVDSLSCKMREL